MMRRDFVCSPLTPRHDRAERWKTASQRPLVPHNAVICASVRARDDDGQRWLRLEDGGWIPAAQCVALDVVTGSAVWRAQVDCELFAHPGHWSSARGYVLTGEHVRTTHAFQSSAFEFARLADGRGWMVVKRVSDGFAQATIVRAAAAPDEDALCVVCLEEPRAAGLVHGETVHRAVCRRCADVLMQRQGATCPVCRAVIDRIVTVF